MSEKLFQDFGQARRKSSRRTFRHSAKVLAPGAIQWDGFIIDISDSGAQLELFDTRGIPDEFCLLIGAVKRVCQVVWRSDDRLGVKFVRQRGGPPFRP
jgi:hypothetical protein